MKVLIGLALALAGLSASLVALSDDGQVDPPKGHFPPIFAENLNVELKNNVGSGFVSFLKYTAKPVTITHTSLMASVKRYPEKLVFNDQENTVEFGIKLSFLDNFSYLNLQGFNMRSEEKLFRFAIPSAHTVSSGGEFQIERLTFKCTSEANPDQILMPVPEYRFTVCADDGSATFESLTVKEGSALAKALSDSPSDPNENLGLKLKEVKLKNMEIVSTQGKFNASVVLDAFINITFKMAGEMKYEAEKNRFALRIDLARAGFLPIKKKIFKIIKSIQIKEITIEEPYVYIAAGGTITRP